MYTYEQRMKAVELFIGSGFSENAVYRELGYPSPQSLGKWYEEYQKTGTLTLHKNSAPQPKYIQQQKEAAVSYYVDNHATLTQLWLPQNPGSPEKYGDFRLGEGDPAAHEGRGMCGFL